MTLSPAERGHHVRGVDDQVHVVVDGGAALACPSHRTLCDRAVVVVCEHQAPTTCSECSRKSRPAEAPVAYEPCG